MTKPDSTPQEPKAQETALATKPSPKTTVITTPEEYHDRLAKWESEKYHVLSPMRHIGAIPQHYGLVPAIVLINPDPAFGEVYQDKLFCEKDEYALARPALGKIALSSGWSIVNDDLTPPHMANYWKVRSTATFMSVDGTVLHRTAMSEYDLRDGSPRVNKIIAAAKRHNRNPTQQIEGARQHGLRGCETRAVNAVIRLVLGLKQKYDVKELKKPFVCVQVVHQPDMTNPVVAKAVTEHALRGTSMLFGPASPTTSFAESYEPPPGRVVGTLGVNADAPATPPQPDVEQHATAQRVAKVLADEEAGLFSIWFEGDDTEYFAKKVVADVATASIEKNQAVKVTVTENEEDGLLYVAELEILGGAATAGTAATTEKPKWPADAKFIAETKILKHGTTPKNVDWTLYQITATNGEFWGTFSGKHVADAEIAKQKGLPVRITDKPNERDASKLDIDTLTIIEKA